MTNLLIEQYGKYKRQELVNSPFSCLLDTDIDKNPHQIDAFCSAVKALKTGGIILADEVGLGKTIEAGLVIKYVIKDGAKHILLVLPATLRKQWEVELIEKFNIHPMILDRGIINYDPIGTERYLSAKDTPCIAIASYDFASKLIKKYPRIKWDFIVIDEAHNLRNVFHGTKRAKNLYDCTKSIPKILLTATPLQNNLSDLHGLVSFIDDRIFGSEKAFNKQYIEGGDYKELKSNLSPVLYRTLRKDVSKYMQFPKRVCKTFDFQLTYDEVILYQRINEFLKRDNLYSLPSSNKGLLVLVIRKMLASSSFAVAETFEVLKKRLQKLYEGTKSADAKEGFDLFFSYLEDEMDDDDFDKDDDDTVFVKQQIQEEIDEVNAIIENAERIVANAKIKALKQAIEAAFAMQREKGIAEKVVVFTESKRTQKYIARELENSGYAEDDMVLFNGESNDKKTAEIYRAYKVKNYGKVNYGRSVEYKHAIVDYFQTHAKILIVTDAGSEGLNLQFCNTVINYDLPWNPMKIEQRIGRCHRYGQQNDVVAINLLNTQNEADQRVYDILAHKFELFDGVFGASDIALGILESGINFEKTVLEIYQSCDTSMDFRKAFDKLDKTLDKKRDKKAAELRNLLLSKDSTAKCSDLDAVKQQLDKYLRQVEYWENIEDEDILIDNLSIMRTPNWGENSLGSHGYLFIGTMCDNARVLFPVLLLCDENGQYVDFDEDDLLPIIEELDDYDIFPYKLTDDEQQKVNKIYQALNEEMLSKYRTQVQPMIDYNKKKVANWINVQKEQLIIAISDMAADLEESIERCKNSTIFLEKVDLKKECDEKMQKIKKFQDSFHSKEIAIEEDGEKEMDAFAKQFDINPILLIKIVLKF